MGAIRKAVVPVAGLGTRFLPATKAMPKEMLTVVDRPVVQWVVDEGREAGIEHFIFVTGRNKGVIEDHFDKQYELEATLRKRGRSVELDLLEAELPAAGQTSFTRQQEPLGLGHAIWCARHLVGDEPFAVLLPDMLIQSRPSCLSLMIDALRDSGCDNAVALEQVPLEHVDRYGVIGGERRSDGFYDIVDMVEKPARAHAPSRLVMVGRYVLRPEIFPVLEHMVTQSSGEIQLTDAMKTLLNSQTFLGVEHQGQSFDCGDKLGFLNANVAYALQRPELADPLRERIAALVLREGGTISWPSKYPD